MFAHDTESALQSAAALVNTEAGSSRSRTDELTSVADVAEFFTGWAYSGAFDRSEHELDALRALRTELRELYTADRDRAAEIVNRMLRESRALPRVVRHDGWDWHLHAVPDDAPLDVRVRAETAMAMVDLVRMDEVDRLKVCAADDCEALFVDLSRNRSKRFCDVGNCGNRANVTAYRARKAAGV